MSTPATCAGLLEPSPFPTRQVLYGMAVLAAIVVGPFLIWPALADRVLASHFLPHRYCYLGRPGLVWSHVIADSFIGLSYFMISGTLGYLVQKGRRDIPFHWMFMAFGAFIVACGGTHFMEVVTVWIPVYVLSATLKVVTALVSVATAVLLPFTVPQILSLVQTAKASEAVEKTLREYEKAVEGLEEMIVVVDGDYRYVLANCAFLNYRGLEREQLIGRLSSEMLNSGVFEAVVKGKLDECLQGKVVKYQLKYKYPKLGERDVSISYFPIEGLTGVDRVACVLQDITERKRAEEALRESEDRYRDLVEHSHGLLCTHDLAGKLLSCNPAPARILGYEVAELLGIPMRELVAPEFREQFDAYLDRIKTAGVDKGSWQLSREPGSDGSGNTTTPFALREFLLPSSGAWLTTLPSANARKNPCSSSVC
jgi:PAS domain S-box-containing protein